MGQDEIIDKLIKSEEFQKTLEAEKQIKRPCAVCSNATNDRTVWVPGEDKIRMVAKTRDGQFPTFIVPVCECHMTNPDKLEEYVFPYVLGLVRQGAVEDIKG